MVAPQNIDTLGPIWTFSLRGVLTFVASGLDIKGTYYAKITFITVFEHSCVAAVCENIQPIMVKIHPLIFLQSKIIINGLSERAVSDSPLCSRHRGEKVPPICDAAL